MACPNCSSHNTWSDNLEWGCNACGWCSLAGLNNTRTPSNPNNRDEVERRRRDWQRHDEERMRTAHEDNVRRFYGEDD